MKENKLGNSSGRDVIVMGDHKILAVINIQAKLVGVTWRAKSRASSLDEKLTEYGRRLAKVERNLANLVKWVDEHELGRDYVRVARSVYRQNLREDRFLREEMASIKALIGNRK